MPGRPSGPSEKSTGKIIVDDGVRLAWLASLDLDLVGYPHKWRRAKALALEHPHLQVVGWSYWRVVRQLFVELGGLPLCWEDDDGRPLPDDHPDRRPWNPWPWWLDPDRRRCGRALLSDSLSACPEWSMSDKLPNVVPIDYNT